MKKVVISVSNNLVTDQRVDKVCNTLFLNGFDVLLIGRNYPRKLSEMLNRTYKTKRIRLLFNKGFLFYAEYNIRLFFILLFTKKDILLANDLDTLLPNFLASRIQRKKLVFDSHELFSEVPELVNKKFIKSVWVQLEKSLIPKLQNNYTVCLSIANYYKEKYNTNFEVIRNLPVKNDVIILKLPFKTNKKIIIYQGAINLGRGLELMINTMKYLDNHLFLIVGSGDIIDDLQKKVERDKLEGKVYFYGKVTPDELQKITPNAILGISLEEDLGLNYRYALPNKIFDYIQANVPVLVSNLPEMRKVVTNYSVGEIVLDRNPEMLANQIENLLEKDFSKALQLAKNELIWKTDEEKLISIFKNFG
ncbi:glycosyltransferase involved in cell wall biosynthesis [Tenacibaculum adriaticum]|uniref:Glycosyltransferase involved in cell wall biosynthesis n=1 Tax=Tenacibaculum adriaticum TaxID=413713 RepID=A0A5S5DST6_9FLAO|nr:glycosyltransferase [Tenacibaculum adriaticum]TYP97922.1 glycosyltransferase involved in cell wall biosynthesis [Tenacibaculum adriaticum]